MRPLPSKTDAPDGIKLGKYKMKMHRNILLAVILLFSAGVATAQDVILKKDNTTVLSKVLEITSTEIKYKKWSNQEGPTYSINRSEVTRINFQNGDVEQFTAQNVPVTHPQQTVVTRPEVQAAPIQPQPQTESKPEKPKSPYARSRMQFSLNGGVAIPVGKFGTTAKTYNSLVDFCAPFQIFSENTGTSSQVGVGAAKTGFSGSMKLHMPFYERGKSIIGVPLKFNILFNGIMDSEKQAYKSIIEPALSETLNEEYGVYAFDFKVSNFSRYWNFSIMTGIDYTYYISKPFALFAEGTMGLSINHVTSTQLQNRLGGTYIAQYSVYSMKEFNFNYNTKATFAYEIGGGVLLFNHLSIGVFYMGNSPVQLSYNIDAANISDGPDRLAQKLQVSALSIQLGVHF